MHHLCAHSCLALFVVPLWFSCLFPARTLQFEFLPHYADITFIIGIAIAGDCVQVCPLFYQLTFVGT